MERVSLVFHLPTADNDGQQFHPADISIFVNRIIRRAGGITIVHCEGVWVHPEGHLIQEQVLRIMVAVPEEGLEELVELINQQLKGPFEQESVYMEVDGKPSIR